MSTQSNDWISVGRVARFLGEGKYHLTVGGDGLASLPLPVKLSVFPPGTAVEGGEGDEDPSTQNPVGVVTLLELVLKGPYGRARIDAEAELEKGTVLCVRSLELKGAAGPGEVFWFDLRGLPVHRKAEEPAVGTLTGLLETGAHDIVEVTTPEGIVLVPLANEFVTIDLPARRVFIPDLDDFRV